MKRYLAILGCSFLMGCTHLFYFPSRHTYVDFNKLKIEHNDIFISTPDGEKLHSVFFPAQKKSPALIVYFHGNAENLTSHFLSLYWAVKSGIDLYAYDYRGYGRSSGEVEHDLIQQDNQLVLKNALLFAKKNRYQKVILYGQSLGGILSLRSFLDLKDKELLKQVKLIVLDSTFDSYQEMAFAKLTDNFWTWPLSWLSYLLISDKHSLRKEDFQSLADRNLLLIHGEDDSIVPLSFGEKIFEEIPSKKKMFWKIPSGKHIDVFTRKKYQKKFIHLVESLK